MDGPNYVFTADMDGDTDQDVIAGGWNANALVWYENRIITTGIELPIGTVPANYVLSQNYPNPFNPSTTIRYALAHAGHVSLKIFNLSGQEVTTLVDGEHDAGEHQIQWQAQGVSSGVYFYQLRVGDYVETRKMLLLR